MTRWDRYAARTHDSSRRSPTPSPELYSHPAARGAGSFDDFGLTPVEGAAFETLTNALRFGGYVDTVIEGTTGVFFFDVSVPSSFVDAVKAKADVDIRPATFANTR